MTEVTTRFFFDTPAQKVDAGTARLAVRSFGTGPPLLLVHGFPESWFSWRHQIKITRVAARSSLPHSPGGSERYRVPEPTLPWRYATIAVR